MESSEYTEYTDDDDTEYTDDDDTEYTDDDDDSLRSVSDDSDDNKGKQLSDREKLLQLEAQIVKGKNAQRAKHKGRYTESEEGESLSEYVTTSEEESIKGKTKNVAQQVNKPSVKRIPRSEEYTKETETTNSETEEETETDDDDDYTAFLMKQLATQQLSMERSNTTNDNANTVENKEECHFGETEKQMIPNSVDTKRSSETRNEENFEGDDTSVIEAKVEAIERSSTMPEGRNEGGHSTKHKTNDLGENVRATSEHLSSSKDSEKISHFQSNSDIKNDLSGDQYKSKDDYSNDANGGEEQKAETGKYENMNEGNGIYNSEADLGFTEVEHMNDKSDNTSMTGPGIDSIDGNEKGEK